MMCQDCAITEATNLIFNQDELTFFCVCDLCIKESDLICPEGLINAYNEDK